MYIFTDETVIFIVLLSFQSDITILLLDRNVLVITCSPYNNCVQFVLPVSCRYGDCQSWSGGQADVTAVTHKRFARQFRSQSCNVS